MAIVNVNENDTFEEWRVKTNAIAQDVGDMNQLATQSKDSIVDAVNELQNSVGSWEIVSTNTIATSGKWYMVDTFAGLVSITLPATPTLGDTFKIMDYSGTFDTNACTLLRNTQKIEGLTSDLVLDVSKADIEIRYTGTTFGWRLVG